MAAKISEKTAYFLNAIQEKAKTEFDTDYHKFTFTAQAGRKFDKIWQGTTIYLFIERATGNIYKPATIKAPAKHVRYTGVEMEEAINKADKFGGFLYMRG